MSAALVVLAAGASRRYGALKQLVTVGPSGEALLDYAIYDALRSGFGEVVLVVRTELEPQFREHIEPRWSGVTIRYAHQTLEAFSSAPVMAGRTKPWGTAHAVLCAAPFVDDTFAVVNADDFYGWSAYEQAAAHVTSRTGADSGCALVAYDLGATLSAHGGVSRAICLTTGDSVRSIIEMLDVRHTDHGIVGVDERGATHELAADSPTSMNFWVMSESVVALLRDRFAAFVGDGGRDADAEFRLSTELNALLADRRIDIGLLRASDEWTGVTYAEDRQNVAGRIADLVERGVYPSEVGTATLEQTE